MKCTSCGEPIQFDKSIEGVCIPCILKQGEALRPAGPMSDRQRRELKATIEQETAGLFPSEALRGVIERGYDRLASGEDFDLVIEDTANEVQRLGGLGMCREMLRVTEALGDMAREQEEEVRKKIRSLSRLSRP